MYYKNMSDNETKKSCGTCKYVFGTEEYWYDHYLIPSRHYCHRTTTANTREVDLSYCCKHYVKYEPQNNSND